MTRSVRSLRRHPRFERLSEFADGGLAKSERIRVSQHLEGCPRCLKELRAIREMDAALRAIPTPGLSPDLFDRILDRRASGVRTVVPSEPVTRASHRHRPFIAAAAMVILAGTALFVATREVDAGASVLTVTSQGPDRADFAASYRAGTALSGAATVRARARVWRMSEGRIDRRAQTAEVGVLRNTGDRFEGTLEFSPDVVYALVVIEERAGDRVDPNGGQFWEVFPDPSLDAETRAIARLAATVDLGGGGMISATRVRAEARRAVDQFPDNPSLLLSLANWESVQATGLAEREQLLSAHDRRLDQVAATVFETHADDPGRLASLLEYALFLERADVADRAVSALATLDPDHSEVASQRLMAAFLEPWSTGEPAAFRRALETVEAEYERGAVALSEVAQAGFDLAKRAGERSTTLRWADRFASVGPLPADAAAIYLSEQPDLRTEGIARLRSRLDHYRRPSDGFRGLHETRNQYEAEIRARRAALQAALGQALRAEGRHEEALDAFRRSIEAGWDGRVAATIVAAAGELATSDPDLRRLSTLAAVDPLYTGSDLRTRLTDVERLDALDELRITLERTVRSGTNPSSKFRSLVGTEVPFDDGGVTLIALWDGVPTIDSDEARELIDHSNVLANAGVRRLVAVPEAWMHEALDIAELAGARPVVDIDGQATDEVGGWAWREYVVVHDGWYTVHHDVREAIRLALIHSELMASPLR